MKKVAAVFMGVLMMTCLGGTLVSWANNHGDTYYSLYYNGDGGDVQTPIRAKTDASSAYIYHQGNVSAYVQVKSNGINPTDGAYHYHVNVGQARYLYNLVYERGYRNCYLQLTPTIHSSILLHGLWSPDSI
ncbi:hypothetical protein FYJ34_10595 [Clostridiaceae bacterium 68-1-5]|uniref:Uncharacterized protein n=2 Tax=Suipraeoptans intestinalis TaxID=2606628 RepID=A0A6N7V3J7_9FIRM|nr:DUF2712 domain-containing protein [Suipraeoptans intestinalis]MSR94690.1 hypothetical protein [Suipraeoptans intestinalis]